MPEDNTLSSQATGAQASAGFGTGRLEPSNWLQDLNIAITIIGPVLALVFVSLRVFVRTQMRTFGWDDSFVVLALIFSVVLSVGTIFVIKLNFIGIHFYDVPQGTDPTPGLIWIYVIGAVYNPVLAFVKQSVLFFILRIAGLDMRVRFISWVTSFVNMAEMVAVLMVVVFQCSPVESFWNLKLGQHCINQQSFALSTALLTIVTDIVVVALPFWVFLGLQMSSRKKLALIVVFSMGLIVTLVSVVRLYTLCVMFSTHDPDVNYTIGPSITIIECNLAILTACAPTLWPLARRWKNLGATENVSSSPSKCSHCQCARHHNAVYLSRPSTRHSGDKRHGKPSMSNMRSFGTDTTFTGRSSSRRGLREMRSFETRDSSTIMSVSQGLRETRNVDQMLEPDVETSLSIGQGTWLDSASPGEYEAGVFLKELNRISVREIEDDIIVVDMGDFNGEGLWDATSDKVEKSRV